MISNPLLVRWLDAVRVRPAPVIVVLVLLLAAGLGAAASESVVLLLGLVIGLVVLLQKPVLGLFAVVASALVLPIELGTGTEVALNVLTLLIPALLGIWILGMVRRRELHLVPSRTTKPLFLFLLAGLIALFIGNVYWDPMVPRSGSFILVQLAQWAIFAFSAGAFWLMGNLAQDETWPKYLTYGFLLLAGCLSFVIARPNGLNLVYYNDLPITLDRAPFWLLLTALTIGQLLFNRKLTTIFRIFLVAVLVSIFVYAFLRQRETLSNWLGVVTVAGVLVWLRFTHLRGAIIILVILGVIVLLPMVYEFAGGADEWAESGGSRLALIGRVIEVTMRNPITGLGPAAYRPYARMEPLSYRGAYWIAPLISSHNNYVDVFSHTGIIGLGIFLWFMVELGRLAWRLTQHFQEGFAAGYVNAMFATWAGILVIMLLADWFLPFVYNIGFPGFQASGLVWLFLGGLIVFEQIALQKEGQCPPMENTA